LHIEPTKQNAGVTLWGDPWALRALYNLVHRVNDESLLIENKEGVMMGLAYDLRKAFEGSRSKSHRDDGKDKCPIYGVKILWPVLITQMGLLRKSMAFMPTTRLDQAVMYEFEAIIEMAVASKIPGQEKNVMDQMQQISAIPGYIEKLLDSRCRYFIELSPKQRLKMLLPLLTTFDPMYLPLASRRQEGDATMIIPPEVFKSFADAGADWPEFKW
jgi:uncharacterized protein DUF6904